MYDVVLPTGATVGYTGNPQTNAGVYTVTANISGGTNYEGQTLTAQLSIDKKALTITALAKTKIYGDTDPSLTYTVTGLLGNETLSGVLSRTNGENVG
ncbi:MAG: hypothetical protein EOO38_10355, partial [Cytophagaceae bacterium]